MSPPQANFFRIFVQIKSIFDIFFQKVGEVGEKSKSRRRKVEKIAKSRIVGDSVPGIPKRLKKRN